MSSSQSAPDFGPLARKISTLNARLSELDSRIASENTARGQMVEELRHLQRLTTAGTLASGIAHECGTILNVVIGRAQMIATGEVQGDDATESAQVIVEQSQRMADLLRRMLGYARREPGHEEVLDKRKDAAGEVTRQTLALLSPLARKRGISLEFSEDPIASRALLQSRPLQQVLTNLIVNGIQATPQGGQLRVGIRQAGAPNHVYIWVEDQGPGIPASQRQEIFEPFFTTKDTGEGTGLGLSLSRDIVLELGGSIDVESEPGKGSRFTVYLPTTCGLQKEGERAQA